MSTPVTTTATTVAGSARLVMTLRIGAAAGAALAVVGSALLIAAGHAGSWWSDFFAFVALMAVALAVFAWLVAPSQPRNVTAWVMATMGFFGGTYVAGYAAVALWAVSDPRLVLGSTSMPADLPLTAAITIMVIEPTVTVALLSVGTFGLLFFPDGTLPSPRWRWVALLAAVSILLGAAGEAWSYRPGSPEVGRSAVSDYGVSFVAILTVLSFGAVLGRYRRSSGATRQQFKWIAWGALALVLSLLAGMAFGDDDRYAELIPLPLMVAATIFVISYGIAVGKYRLYDIDVVINRTLLVGLLAAVLSTIYVAVVVGLGSFVGSGGRTSFEVQVAATALVAIAFGPAKRTAQQWANRAIYGHRATPYEILARFSHRVADASDEELLRRIPKLIVDGTAASEAFIWLRTEEGYRAAAAWPETQDTAEIAGTEFFDDPNADYSVPVYHDGEILGGLSWTRGRGEALSPSEEQLVKSLSAGLGLALRNSELTLRLRAQVAELEASRDRVLAAADEARRALEHDLDSGPQQQLVALKVMLGPIRVQAQGSAGSKTADLLAQLEADAGEAIRAVREFSGGVYPPLLEAEGLAVAIKHDTQRAAVPVSVSADGLGRYRRDVEAAVYFAILEAIQNAAKYARASAVAVELRQSNGELTFVVRDDGAGFDPGSVTAGSGLANMVDRLDAIGGTLTVDSSPGEGTIVRGSIRGAQTLDV